MGLFISGKENQTFRLIKIPLALFSVIQLPSQKQENMKWYFQFEETARAKKALKKRVKRREIKDNVTCNDKKNGKNLKPDLNNRGGFPNIWSVLAEVAVNIEELLQEARAISHKNTGQWMSVDVTNKKT